MGDHRFGDTTTIRGTSIMTIFTILITIHTAMVGVHDGDTEIHGIMAITGVPITPGDTPNFQPIAGLTEDVLYPEQI